MGISRRRLFHTAATLVGAIASASVMPVAFAQSSDPNAGSGSQVGKSTAQYQDHPNGEQSCSHCANFQAPSACLVVAGAVAPSGWCKLFKPKSA